MENTRKKEFCVWCDIPDLFLHNNITVNAPDEKTAADIFFMMQGIVAPISQKHVHAVEKIPNQLFYSLVVGGDTPLLNICENGWGVAKTSQEVNFWEEEKIVCGWVMPQ